MELNKTHIKYILVNSPLFMSFSSRVTKKSPRIFVYHRFGDRNKYDPTVIDRETFAWHLEKIKRYCTVLTLGEYVSRVVEEKNLPKNIAVITVDDGYRDFYDIAFPLLQSYGLKATFFITVNFIEKKIWLWPDILYYVLENSSGKNIFFEFKGISFELDLKNEGSIFFAWKRLSDYCIGIGDHDKWILIEKLMSQMNIVLPHNPPSQFEPVSWSQVKEMSEYGIEIGSHTMNHPILSKVDEKNLLVEIEDSKNILNEKIGKEILTFCYPNSYPDDITDRVVGLVKKSGYKGAVFGTGPSRQNLFQIPRIGITTEQVDFLWKLSGMEIFILSIRKNNRHSKINNF